MADVFPKMTDFASSRRFYDDQNFPYGIDRSGEFTSRQAELLHLHGHAYHELASGMRIAATAKEDAFVEVFRGGKQATSEDERVWAKYLSLIERPGHHCYVSLNLSSVLPDDDYLTGTD